MKNMCQSCGMPLSKDPEKGGTEKDGSKTSKYCSYCYQDGEFLGDFKTAKQMQDFSVEAMSKQGIPKWVAWLMTRHIPNLERWKK